MQISLSKVGSGGAGGGWEGDQALRMKRVLWWRVKKEINTQARVRVRRKVS